jgi:hypothetical protein
MFRRHEHSLARRPVGSRSGPGAHFCQIIEQRGRRVSVTLIHGGDAPNLVGQRLSVLSKRTDDEIAAELGLSAEQMAEFRAE